jgi:hypothetical protein
MAPGRDHPQHLRIGSLKIPLPASRIARIAAGVVLILAGILGWLPLLGFWMIPLGLLVLSYDVPIVARWRKNISAWWRRRKTKSA